jgi:serine protease Do
LKIATIIFILFLPFALNSSAETPTQIPTTLGKIKAGDPLPANLFIELAKAVNPGVVNIYTTYLPKGRSAYPGRDPFFDMFEQFSNPYGGPRRPAQALGTGFIIREDGLIVTNNHVIDQADVIKVQVDEKTKESYDAKVIGTDAATDLALIRIETKKKLFPLKLGTSADLQVGEWVAAFGNPYGHGHSMTKGIISAVGREIDELNLAPFIQTDASINPGNSGGPLVNTQGLVIGVNSAIDARAQGIGFAIPIDTVKTIIAQLEKSGTIERGFIGVSLVDVDEEGADGLGVSENEGAMIIEVAPGSPAARAGLLPYDLITSFDGAKIGSSSELMKAVKNATVGKKVPITIIRNSKPKNLSVVVTSPKQANSLLNRVANRLPKKSETEGLAAPHNLGFTIANYSPAIAQVFGLPKSQAHPVVVEVIPGSEAASSGLAAGDVILDVNRNRAEKASDVIRNLKSGITNVMRVLKQDRVVLISLKAR